MGWFASAVEWTSGPLVIQFRGAKEGREAAVAGATAESVGHGPLDEPPPSPIRK